MKRLIDDRGRLFGRVSIIDILFIIVVIVILTAAFTKFNVQDSPLTTPDTVEITYTVLIQSVRVTAGELLRPGDNLYAQETGTFIGTITNVEISGATSPEPLVDGTFVVGTSEERYDIVLTVVVQGSVSGGRYFADRTIELNANGMYKLVTKHNEITGFILTISAG